ncbi:hypothetical protein [Variovorax rhizosphaerae]|uniref:Uncharacterized protein n=1 Tax=Variovorax rhizosphaerae TaxID=1836200 RepID=A0ABU8WWE3_9BURK
MTAFNRTIAYGIIALAALGVLAGVLSRTGNRAPQAASGSLKEPAFATRFQPVAPVIEGIGSTRALTPVDLGATKFDSSNGSKAPAGAGVHHESAKTSR